MEQIKVLLCCGAGMSSGLIAQKARKAAKKRGVQASFEARSESEATQYLSSIDCLLLGPHFESYLETMKKQAEPYGVPVKVIPKQIYAMIDGDALVDLALQTVADSK